MFPTIQYTCKAALIASHLNIILSRKQSRTIIRYSKKTARLILALQRTGVIYNFTVISRRINKKNLGKFIVCSPLFYKNTAFFKSLRLVSTQSKKHFITYQALQTLSTCIGTSLLVLSTSRGIISHREALYQKIGGIIIYILS